MSDKNSACATLISNICERDRAKDVEPFDDFLKAFINETNEFKNRFGKIRDKEQMLAAKKLLLESLLKFRIRGATLTDEELLMSLEKIIIIDKFSTAETTKQKKFDTSAPKEIGMATKDYSDSSREDAVCKGTGEGSWRS